MSLLHKDLYQVTIFIIFFSSQTTKIQLIFKKNWKIAPFLDQQRNAPFSVNFRAFSPIFAPLNSKVNFFTHQDLRKYAWFTSTVFPRQRKTKLNNTYFISGKQFEITLSYFQAEPLPVISHSYLKITYFQRKNENVCTRNIPYSQPNSSKPPRPRVDPPLLHLVPQHLPADPAAHCLKVSIDN